ncbi:DUF313 domain-containing protein [Cephalotus follicularis]|uniref:DUF313 domain-containing protein n=1 Tax=Cephalotus follicularis TaxID=3775 RepID=A0A1Q3CSH2_CEPFO|nr:DUF313 domain-containing protein [Cephalotus follicularis]
MDLGFVEVGHLEPPPPMSQELKKHIEAMNGTDPVLVIQKKLFKTDLSARHNRLLIPILQTRKEFLTVDERRGLERGEGITLRFIEPCLDEDVLVLKKWAQKTTSNYVLIKNWYRIVNKKKNMLLLDAVVQFYAFRIGTHLCGALAIVRDGNYKEITSTDHGSGESSGNNNSNGSSTSNSNSSSVTQN